MRTSESIVNISKALLGFQSEIGNIPKAGYNSHYKAKHAKLEDILPIVDPLLTKCGIVILQEPGNTTVHQGSEGITMSLVTRIIHAESGEYIESECSFPMEKRTPHEAGKCITYMRRYSLVSILKLNTDDDDDGNSASNISNGGAQNKTYPPSKDINKKITSIDTKTVATEIDVQELGLRFMEANSLDELKNVYISIVKDVKTKYSNSEDVINKLEIMKDSIKGRYK